MKHISSNWKKIMTKNKTICASAHGDSSAHGDMKITAKINRNVLL